MALSARNQFKGKVRSVRTSAVMSVPSPFSFTSMRNAPALRTVRSALVMCLPLQHARVSSGDDLSRRLLKVMSWTLTFPAPPPLPVSPGWSPVKEYGGYAKAPDRSVGASHSACSHVAASSDGRTRSHLQVLSEFGLWGLGCDCFAF